MLTVISILALLMGLLLPALSRVRAAGRSLTCQSNLRQMGFASQQYANVFDAWPAAIRYEHVDGVLQVVAWDWVSTFDGRLVAPGPLWAFSGAPGDVPQCPDYHGTTNFEGDPYTGYNYNTSYLGAEAPFPSTGWEHVRAGVRPHACRRGAACAMFGDGGRGGGTNKFMRAPSNHEGALPEVIYSGGQAFRHPGGTNVAFVDGHVGPVTDPRAGPTSTATLLDDVMDYPSNGFLSEDDAAYDPR
jgi:prepilin-type processing-associated H-X9-DG protein